MKTRAQLIKEIMAEFEKDGEPVTEEEAGEIADLEIKAKKTSGEFCVRLWYLSTSIILLLLIIDTLTIDEFLDYYGSKIIMSVGHWKVKWIKYGVGWDN